MQPPHCLCWVLQKATQPSYLPVAAGQERTPVPAPVLGRSAEGSCMSLVLWQRVRAAAWDRRGWVSAGGWGEEVVFTPAWIPYKISISHESLDNFVFCTYFFQPPHLFGFNI